MGQYKKRKDGRYYARVRTGRYDDKGRPEEVYIYAKSEAALKKP